MSQRFSVKGELDRIDRHFHDESKEWGTEVEWLRYDPQSPSHDVYDVGSPRSWSPPIQVPVLWALRIEGRYNAGETGLDPADSLTFAVAKTEIRDRLGWENIVDRDGVTAFLRDRIRYEGRTFTIDSMQVEGQLGHSGGSEDRDVILAVVAREVKPGDQFIDEDPQTPEDPVYG